MNKDNLKILLDKRKEFISLRNFVMRDDKDYKINIKRAEYSWLEFKGWNKRKINIKASILADVLEKLIQEQDKKIDDLINARK